MPKRANSAAIGLGLLLFAFAPSAAALCGDADNDGAVRATDALRTLIAAVGSSYDPRLDVERGGLTDGVVTAGDALVILQQALTDTLFGCALSAATRAMVVTASNSFASGGITEIALATRNAVQQPNVTAGDTVPRISAGRAFLLNRFGANNVEELDADRNYATLFQCALGAGTDPVDIVVVSATKAYVSQYDSTVLAIVDPSVGPSCNGFVTGGIELAAYADADGIPEMDQMVLVDGSLYIALQLLDRTAFFAPTGPGVLVEIDSGTDTVIGTTALEFSNPFGETKGLAHDSRAHSLYISSPGRFFSDLSDGGIEAVDTITRAPVGAVITGGELGGDLTDFVMVGSSRGYGLVADAQSRHRLVAFDSATATAPGTVTATLAESDETFSDIEVSERGELYLCDRSFTAGVIGGVRVFSVRSNEELTTAPIDTGLLPFNVVFLK